MPPWVGSALGLSLGLALGGGAFVAFVLPAPRPSPPAQHAAIAPPRPAPEPPPRMGPAPLPEPEPKMISPEAPPLDSVLRPPPGESYAMGTGFFISNDGSLLTANHVVTACQRARIASTYIDPSEAQVVVRDPVNDIALLRAAVRPPAVLPVGPASTGSNRLFVLGYPGGGPIGQAAETWAHVVTEAVPLALRGGPSWRGLVWLENPDITHGYSGGPILDPISGQVVAIVRATILYDKVPTYIHLPARDLAIGPGSYLLGAFVHAAHPAEAVVPVPVGGDRALQAARRATVRVYCWR